MAIIDKLVGVGSAVRDKVANAFKDRDDADGDDDADGAEVVSAAPRLDVPAARALLGVTASATRADVRAAYDRRARPLHASARGVGVDSEPARALDRLLDAFELLEEVLVPLPGDGGRPPAADAAAAPRRKRATARSDGR